jgi:hypothetical protein
VDTPFAQPARRRGALVLADISGYTGFLQGVADAHRDLIVDADEPPPAYALLSHLLDSMLASLVPQFRLAKFEGDASSPWKAEPIPHRKQSWTACAPATTRFAGASRRPDRSGPAHARPVPGSASST